MAQTFPYCNTTDDLQAVFKDIEKFQSNDTLVTWTLNSGSTYQKNNTGHVGAVWENGTAYGTEKTSIATVEAAQGSWWWDPTNDILYVHSSDSADPDTHTITANGVGIWSAIKQRAVDEASEEFESMLNNKYPLPLPFARRSYRGLKYDSKITEAVAYLADSRLVKARDIDNSIWKSLYAEVWDPENEKGIAWNYYKGIWSFSFEATQDEFDGNLKRTVIGTDSTGRIHLAGKGSRGNRRKVSLVITTSGTPGTAVYKISSDNETTWTENLEVLAYHNYQHLIDDIYLKFEGSFIATDAWELNSLGDEGVTNPVIQSLEIRP